MLEVIIVAVGAMLVVVYAILGFKKPGIGMLTSPAAGLLLFYISSEEDCLPGMTMAPLIFLAAVMAAAISRGEADFEAWPKVWARWMLIASVVLLLSAGGFALFGPWGIFGLLFAVLFIGMLISYGLTSRYAIAAYVVSTIGSSMRQNLPLPMALESAVSGQSDQRARALRGIKKWLVEGYSLSESIRRGYPKCPGYVVAMIAAAERIDQLPQAMEGLEADMMAQAEESRKIKPLQPLYPVVVLGALFLIFLGLMTYVIPKFKEILDEMFGGEPFPAVTQFVLNVASFIAYDMGWLLLIIVGFVVFVVIPVWLHVRFRPRRPHEPYLISRIGDCVKWHFPVLHWFEQNYSLLQVVELLRLSLNAGCTVNRAIANTLDLDVNNCLRGRVQKWLSRVEAGENISAAAQEEGLGSCLAWAFDEKVNRGNTLDVLETLETFYRTNYSYRVNLIKFILSPCVTIGLGIIVGLVVYAVFSPGVAVINHLATKLTP
ncbi:MAG: type II secretion system F family protein [Planctomycetota bacterium]|jgi:type IV pilus assembly protein PilC